jgi:transcriptional regulator with XRE-family HTH domain
MTKNQLHAVIGANIKKERNARCMTLNELATSIDVSPGSLDSIERGERSASPYTLYALANMLDISVDSLFIPSGK